MLKIVSLFSLLLLSIGTFASIQFTYKTTIDVNRHDMTNHSARNIYFRAKRFQRLKTPDLKLVIPKRERDEAVIEKCFYNYLLGLDSAKQVSYDEEVCKKYEKNWLLNVEYKMTKEINSTSRKIAIEDTGTHYFSCLEKQLLSIRDSFTEESEEVFKLFLVDNLNVSVIDASFDGVKRDQELNYGVSISAKKHDVCGAVDCAFRSLDITTFIDENGLCHTISSSKLLDFYTEMENSPEVEKAKNIFQQENDYYRIQNILKTN